MSGIFEHLSAFDDQQRVATRKAVAVAHKRFEDRFSRFLNEATDLDDYNRRYALVEEEIKDMVEDVGAEYDADPERLEASLKEAKGGFCDDCKKWKSGPKAGCTCGSDSSDKKDDDHEEDNDTFDLVTDDDEDPTNKPKASESSVKQADITTQPIMTAVPLPDEPGKGVPDIDGELEDAPSAVGYQTISATDPEEGSEKGTCGNCNKEAYLKNGLCADCQADRETSEGESRESSVTPTMHRARQLMAARQSADVPTGDSAEKREKLPKGDESAQGGPVPKTDKKKWKPNALNDSGNLKPIDTEGKGSKNPTVDQDIKEKPDWETDDFLRDTGENTTESQTLSEDTGDFTAPHTDTWTSTDGLADPVTQTALASTHEAEQIPGGQRWDVSYPDQDIIDQHGGNQHVDPTSSLIPCPQCGAASGEFDGQKCIHCGYQESQQSPFEQHVRDQGLQTDLGPDRRAATDPDKNPIKEILESKVDFIPQDDVLSAISSFEER